jgi:serine/threonine protein kinase
VEKIHPGVTSVEDRTIIRPGIASGSVRRGVRLNGIYEVGSLIAHGGMGEVYRGFNIVTNDPVAIKMILPELSRNPEAFAMFKREASTLNTLQHEAIVRYFVFSVDPEIQRAYLAMEFVDGPSLSKRLANGPLPIEEVQILRRRLADALDLAHRHGVIHRDISSDNVILPDADARRAKIIDFGIARSQRVGEGTIIGGGFAGKYNYVSPEQLGLAGGEVTAKSDIFSLGLVLAEALRGRPIDMGGSQAEIIDKRRKVPDLSDIHSTMRPLIAAMLQPSPADRPDSMAAVAAWTPAGTPRLRSKADRQQGRAPGAGRGAAIAAALIIVASLGGTFYAFRDFLPYGLSSPTAPSTKQGAPSTAPKPPAAPSGPTPDLPPLIPAPSAPTTPSFGGLPAPPPSEERPSQPSPPPGTEVPHVPSPDEILKEAKRTNHGPASLEPPPNGNSQATAPSEQPAQNEPSSPSAPGSQLKQPPKESPAPTQSDQPSTTLPPLASAAIPHAPYNKLKLDEAVVGRQYEALLPPFDLRGNLRELSLRAGPGLPDGLVFTDLGSGLGKISGAPRIIGQYSFDIIASADGGGATQMETKLAVVEPPPATPVEPPAAPVTNPPTPISPADRATSFLARFEGGACFFIRLLGFRDSTPIILGVGADVGTFQRFDDGFKEDVGIDPNLRASLIARAQCPALDLIRANAAARVEPPKIEIPVLDIGRNQPLAGTISRLDGRNLALLLVRSDGQVHRIEPRIRGDGSTATFSETIVADPTSKGVSQIVMAIVSPKPLPSLAGFKTGAAADILPRVAGDLSTGDASLETEFIQLR